ncbi:MAG: sigma 54-interacting transcriptional regulator [Deltaproteobacteria bacterium]|nr:sigma 54-interacting transcriptional regulator [Deltaproteobacteria bacterium]
MFSLWNQPDKTKAILDSIYNPVIAIDDQGNIVMFNRAMERITGNVSDEIYGRPLNSVITNAQLTRILETGRSEVTQKIEIGDRMFTSNRAPIVVNGQMIGAVSILQDISELEAISSELHHSKRIMEELTAIIESSFDGIYVTDGEARTIRVNGAYERITGVKREEVLGRTMYELVAEGFYNESVTVRVLQTRRPGSLIQKIKTGKTVMVTGNPIFDSEGNIVLVVTNVRDVTELHRLQQKLENMDRLQSEREIELRQLKETFLGEGQIVIRSKKMKDLTELALRLAQVDSTVLIQGESGTGKEVLADFIHRNGSRRDQPLIKISCAAIPDQLLEAELFGYAPGAFTGARKEGKAGIFEVARKGTVFMDEIGEMPLGLQAKLLRVLQEKEITRVGDTVSFKADVRLMAATNRDLETLVEQGQFRKDLFFRLNVIQITVPPLRERREAIVKLVYHFMDKFNGKFGLSKQMNRQVLDILIDYDWPGNIRELENAIERMVVVTPGEVITLEDLPPQIRPRSSSSTNSLMEGRSLKEILAEVERLTLEESLKHHKTTREVARALGLNQSNVVRKLKRHRLSAETKQ